MFAEAKEWFYDEVLAKPLMPSQAAGVGKNAIGIMIKTIGAFEARVERVEVMGERGEKDFLVPVAWAFFRIYIKTYVM